MLKWCVIAGLAWVVLLIIRRDVFVRVLRWLIDAFEEQSALDFMENNPERMRLLALAHPVLKNHSLYAELDTDLEDNIKELQQDLKIQLDINRAHTPEHIQRYFTAQAKTQWMRWDVDQLKPDDDWRDGMAFACARAALALRASHLLGWLDEDTQWQLLLFNAQRAQACFDSWQDFAQAWMRGRQQWIARSRMDLLGTTFNEEDIDHWLEQGDHHPWSHLNWDAELTTEPSVKTAPTPSE